MATCDIETHSDMYGLGIRIEFYIQWFGIIIAYWLGESSVQDLRVLNALLVFAASLALVIQTAMNSIHAVEIYILLLLAFGQYYFAIPFYLWRLITGCHPNWNLSRWPQAPDSPIFRFLTFLLFVLLLGYQMWFWTTGIRELRTSCQQYGFLFTKIPLDNSGFIAVNIMFNLALLLGACWVLCVAIGIVKGKRRKRKRRARKVEIEALQELQSLFDLTVAVVMVTAIELVVQWNHLNRSNNVSTAAQLIPLIVSAGILLHVFFLWLARRSEFDDGETSRPSSRPRSPPFEPFHYPQDPGGSGGTRGGNDNGIVVEEEVSEMAMSTAASSVRNHNEDRRDPALHPDPLPPQPQPPPPANVPPGGRPPPPPMPAFVPGRGPGGMPPPPPPPMSGGGLGGGGRPPPPPIQESRLPRG